MGQVKTYLVLLGASADLSEGTRWYRREAEGPEGAVTQLVSDLGREGNDISEAQVVEIAELPVTVTQQTRWEAQA